jgi:hypothetical protein
MTEKTFEILYILTHRDAFLKDYKIENVVLVLLCSCPLPRERVYRVFVLQHPLFIRPSRGRCIAATVHAIVLKALIVQIVVL